MVNIVTVLLAGWSWVQIFVETKHFSLLQNIQTSSWTHPAFCIRVPGFFPGIKAARTWKLTTDVHLLEIFSFIMFWLLNNGPVRAETC